MSYPKALVAWALIALLGGCAGYVGEKVERIRPAAPGGEGFNQALAAEYREIALFESDEMSDWIDAERFAAKALIAAEGDVVLPEHLSNWNLSPESKAELASARRRLMEALDGGARKQAPREAARAQVRFDCWVEQQEENHQPDHIDACRGQFHTALANIESELLAGTILVPGAGTAGGTPPAERSFVVFFPIDGDRLDAEAQAVIAQAVESAARLESGGFLVTGHADRAGVPAYNRDLSRRRAEAVERALLAGGAAPGSVELRSMGEEAVAVPTQDEIYEPANRRVEIILR